MMFQGKMHPYWHLVQENWLCLSAQNVYDNMILEDHLSECLLLTACDTGYNKSTEHIKKLTGASRRPVKNFLICLAPEIWAGVTGGSFTQTLPAET